jgi:hypothetical protein
LKAAPILTSAGREQVARVQAHPSRAITARNPTTRASSSKLRSIVNPAPAVFSKSSRHDSAPRARLHRLPQLAKVGPGPALPLPGTITPPAPIPSDRQRVRERGERLAADLRVVACHVDQVDGVNVDGPDRALRDALAERREVVGGVLRRPPRARALVEDLHRLRAALLGALEGPHQPARGRDVGSD